MRLPLLVVFILIAGVMSTRANPPAHRTLDAKLLLRDGWAIQCSACVPEGGDVVSTERVSTRGWYPATVPGTVFDVLVRNKVYPEPYSGMNLRLVPGYPHETAFSRPASADALRPAQSWVEHWLIHAPNRVPPLSMPTDSPFKTSWWYRSKFNVPASVQQKNVWLNFEGINYRANVWLNGRMVADSNTVAGAYRSFEFNVTDLVRPGEANVLAVEVWPPRIDDLAINWVDVSPTPPDDNMGIWHQVSLTTSGAVAVRFPQVISRLDMPSLAAAHLTVNADLYNASGKTVRGVLKGRIEGIRFQQAVEIGPKERKRVAFSPDKFLQLTLPHPRVWWPWQMGEQHLYALAVQFETGGNVSDRAEVQFGIREVTSELTPAGHRLFMVNGRRILIRGGMWWSDMLLRSSAERQEAEMRYVRDMHLNCIRMDGKFENENFLRLADRYGMLLMPGWCCGDHWEKWDRWKKQDYAIATESLRNVIRSFRNHPSLMAWLNADDYPPPEHVAQMYVNVLREENWPNPHLASATGKPAAVSGNTGVKMSGPYEYVPPAYWLTDKTLGGAHGFLTETSIGGAVPPFESILQFIPPDHLWPVDEYWDYHAGGGKAFVRDLKATTEALTARYGAATNVQDYALKSQVLNYEGQRAMFEAFGRNKYLATGVIHEMLNQAWPSMIWQLYDYYLRPGGNYFGTKKGCEPLHIQYSYDDRSIVVVNSYYRGFRNLRATARVYTIDLHEKYSREVTIDVPPDSSLRLFTVPSLDSLSKTYFVRLVLQDPEGKVVSRNFYWLSTKADQFDWGKSTWFHTPANLADLTALQVLPDAAVKVAHQCVRSGKESRSHITVENPTDHLAFFVHLRITKGEGGEEVLPILWEDNYFELMPGEKRVINASYAFQTLAGATPFVEVDGWNVAKVSAKPGW